MFGHIDGPVEKHFKLNLGNKDNTNIRYFQHISWVFYWYNYFLKMFYISIEKAFQLNLKTLV